jgi:FixJ family two-component response regulator
MAARNDRAASEAQDNDSVVYVVDDDDSLREALAGLIRVVGLKAECFTSAQDFLKARRADVPSCLVLDVRLPGISGLNLQSELAKAGIAIPIIFMTAHGDIPMTVSAMKAGAAEFLTKPFRDQDMLDAIHTALQRDRLRRAQERSQSDLRSRFESLTAREREIMTMVVAGLMNKQIAAKLELAEITVKIHRGSAGRKMGAKSLAEMVKMAQALGLDAGKA